MYQIGDFLKFVAQLVDKRPVKTSDLISNTKYFVNTE